MVGTSQCGLSPVDQELDSDGASITGKEALFQCMA